MPRKKPCGRSTSPTTAIRSKTFCGVSPANSHYAVFTCGGDVVGFSGLRIDRVSIGGVRRLLIYFGQVVIDEPFRGKSLIPMVAAKLCMKYWKDLLFTRLYFWADCLTYKAYLIFAKTIDQCYPTYRYAMPADHREIIHYIGNKYYRDSYNPASGTVHKDRKLVCDPAARIARKYTQDKDILFFTKANPLHTEGHGLLTLAPMNRCNLRMLFARYIRKAGPKFRMPKPVTPPSPAKGGREFSVE